MKGVCMDTMHWRPKIGLANTMIVMAGLALIVSVILAYTLTAFGAASTIKAEPGFDVKSLLTVLLPTVWASIGPLVIATITKFSNSALNTYVPRSIQIIVSSILGAVAAGIADGGATIAATAVSGAASQIYAATQPASLLSTKREP